jgi:hypothetical protein
MLSGPPTTLVVMPVSTVRACGIIHRGHGATTPCGNVAAPVSKKVLITMYFPTTFTTPVIDPIKRERIESGRPATRWEIVQRHHQESRLNASLLVQDDESSTTGSARAHRTPTAISGIRRAVSRMLITTGERIDPEAA